MGEHDLYTVAVSIEAKYLPASFRFSLKCPTYQNFDQRVIPKNTKTISHLSINGRVCNRCIFISTEELANAFCEFMQKRFDGKSRKYEAFVRKVEAQDLHYRRKAAAAEAVANDLVILDLCGISVSAYEKMLIEKNLPPKEIDILDRDAVYDVLLRYFVSQNKSTKDTSRGKAIHLHYFYLNLMHDGETVTKRDYGKNYYRKYNALIAVGFNDFDLLNLKIYKNDGAPVYRNFKLEKAKVK